MRAAALPPTDDVVALGDEVGRSVEAQVRERGTEPPRELAHFVPAAARRVHGVLEADVGSGELVDDVWVVFGAPELCKPAPDDGLVVFSRHACTSLQVADGYPEVGRR